MLRREWQMAGVTRLRRARWSINSGSSVPSIWRWSSAFGRPWMNGEIFTGRNSL